MKKHFTRVLFSILLCSLPTLAQEQYMEGPIWDVTFVRTKPNQRDAYLTSLRENTKPVLEEEKRQGLITDYKIISNLTQHDPQEWDVAVAVQHKNFAALDGFEARELAIRDRLAGSKKAADQTFNEKHGEMREIVSTKIMQELILK
jgi:hypothetical protein